LISVSRWACLQNDWPTDARVGCRNGLVECLLSENATETEQAEATRLLLEIVAMSEDDASAVRSALWGHRMLNRLGGADAADRVLATVAARVQGSRRWEPTVLIQQIETLIARGHQDAARSVLNSLLESYPDYDVDGRFDALFVATDTEESK
jgi:uncharacterized protein HemY